MEASKCLNPRHFHVETKTKIGGNLGVEIKAKEKELFTWVRQNENHKLQFDDDESLHTFFSQTDDLMLCSELSTKTNLRKNVEAKIDESDDLTNHQLVMISRVKNEKWTVI